MFGLKSVPTFTRVVRPASLNQISESQFAPPDACRLTTPAQQRLSGVVEGAAGTGKIVPVTDVGWLTQPSSVLQMTYNDAVALMFGPNSLHALMRIVRPASLNHISESQFAPP